MIDFLLPLMPGWADQPTIVEQLEGKPRWVKPALVEGPPPPPDVVPVEAPPEPPPPPLVEELPGGMPIPPIVKDGSRAAFLAVAASQIGWMEYSGNENPWSNSYDTAYPNGAYCGQGLSWAFDAAGVPGDWKGAASQRYVPAAYNYWALLGRIIPAEQIQPGDLLMFDWEGDGALDHIEVAVGLEFIGNGEVSVVGYNTGYPQEGVHWTTRGLWQITAVARPSFTDAP